MAPQQPAGVVPQQPVNRPVPRATTFVDPRVQPAKYVAPLPAADAPRLETPQPTVQQDVAPPSRVVPQASPTPQPGPAAPQAPDNGVPPAQDVALPNEPVTTAPPTDSADSLASAAADIDLSTIDLREKEAAENSELSDEVKLRVTELYNTARSSIERADQLQRRRKELDQSTATAAQRAATATARLRQLSGQNPQPATGKSLAEYEDQLSHDEAELEAVKKRKLELDLLATKRTSRRNDIRRRLAELDDEIDEVKKQAQTPAKADESPLLAQARRTEALCHLRSLTLEKPTLEAELASIEAETTHDVLQLERNQNALELEFWTAQVQLTANVVQKAREAVAGNVLADATEIEAIVPEPLRSIAEANRRLAEENQDLTAKIRAAEQQRQSIKSRLDRINERYTEMQAKVGRVGLPASVGAMLRNAKIHLPKKSLLQSSINDRNKEIEAAQLHLMELEELQTRLFNIPNETQRVLTELSGPGESLLTDVNIEIVNRLLMARHDVVNSLLNSQTRYFDSLTDTDVDEVQLEKVSAEFRDYIDERVLWIRSDQPMYETLGSTHWQHEIAGFRPLAEAPRLVDALADDARQHPVIYLLGIFFAGALLVVRPVLRDHLSTIATRTRGGAYNHFTPSLTALVLNMINCLAAPFVLGFLAWRLGRMREPAALVNALSTSCLATALVMLPLSFFGRVFAKDGLADAHFDWSRRTTNVMRSNLAWIGWILLPIIFIATCLFRFQAANNAGMIHRLLFIAACASGTIFLWRIMHPRRGIPADFLLKHDSGWLNRMQTVWFYALLAIPVAIGVLTFLGYSYTARELAWRGLQSVAIVSLLWILHGLFMRLTLVHRRKLSIETARAQYAEYQRKQQEQAALRQKALEKRRQEQPDFVDSEEAHFIDDQTVISDLPGVSVTHGGLVLEDDPVADLREHTAQSRRLVSTLLIGAGIAMLWLTWHNVLPALSILERWPLWDSTKLVVEKIETDSGWTEFRKHEVPDPVTITDLLLACMVAGLGFVASRNLPGLLELSVLTRLPLERSVRYAITTLCSYAIAFIGLFVACRLIGLRWQQIQWMATALTFGLAFGLQEMFANFVAGIIILFERPVRVGDIVTIDQVSGTVSRIRMRATTVTNWDRKDYIVPNKDFITGRLLNWTLSDQVNRILINVGVAYGSDLPLAKKLLIQIASDNPWVVSDPAPIATFEEFSDSSLKVVLRCFIAMENMPMRLEVVDQLHSAIDEAYRTAGIEIAFPQQDIHVRDYRAA